jgi:hypothetical protein
MLAKPNPSVGDIHGALLECEGSLRQAENDVHSMHTQGYFPQSQVQSMIDAAVAKVARANGKKGGKKGGGKRGHTKNNRPNNQKPSNTNVVKKGNGKNVECWDCKQKGHVRGNPECPVEKRLLQLKKK